MSIYCDCRHCKEPQLISGQLLSTFVPVQPLEPASFKFLVKSYRNMDEKEFSKHWEAIQLADELRAEDQEIRGMFEQEDDDNE